MAITYKVTKCRNPKHPDENYFKGTVQKNGELTMEKLAKRINDSTTVTTADCYAVLKSMKQHIIEALYEGQVVVLEDIGLFQVSLQGKSYNEETLADPEFKPAEMIKSWKVVFRPDPRLKEEIRKEFKLQRISSEWMKLLLCHSVWHEANENEDENYAASLFFRSFIRTFTTKVV